MIRSLIFALLLTGLNQPNTIPPMGVTIHYRGRLRRKEEIQTQSNEVEDLCKSAQWKYQR